MQTLIQEKENLIEYIGHELKTPLTKAKFAINNNDTSLLNKTIDDIGSLLVTATANNVLDSKVGIFVWTGDVQNLQGIKLKINLYATSEKPLLKAFTEPVYGMIAGLWSTLVALYNRVRQYVLSFFGGFSISAFFTGLIGDPTTALIITAVAVAVFFFALARPAPKRRD